MMAPRAHLQPDRRPARRIWALEDVLIPGGDEAHRVPRRCRASLTVYKVRVMRGEKESSVHAIY